MGDQKTEERPQTQQRPGQQQQQQPQGERPNPQSGGDQGKVGQDTDGDGKVVKPGQPPGQSGGQGLDK